MKRVVVPIILLALFAAACGRQQEGGSAALTSQAATLQALQTAVADLQTAVADLQDAQNAVAAANAAAEGRGEGEREKTPTATSPATATPTPTPVPLPTATLTKATTLQGATGVLFSVDGATWQGKVEGFYPPQGHRWLVLRLTLSNPLGNPPVDYDPLWFSLVDEHGHVLAPAPVPGVLFNARMFTLLAGDTIGGRLVFAVAKRSAAHLTLVLQDDPLNFQPPLQVQLDVPPTPTPMPTPTPNGEG